MSSVLNYRSCCLVSSLTCSTSDPSIPDDATASQIRPCRATRARRRVRFLSVYSSQFLRFIGGPRSFHAARFAQSARIVGSRRYRCCSNRFGPFALARANVRERLGRYSGHELRSPFPSSYFRAPFLLHSASSPIFLFFFLLFLVFLSFCCSCGNFVIALLINIYSLFETSSRRETCLLIYVVLH